MFQVSEIKSFSKLPSSILSLKIVKGQEDNKKKIKKLEKKKELKETKKIIINRDQFVYVPLYVIFVNFR